MHIPFYRKYVYVLLRTKLYLYLPEGISYSSCKAHRGYTWCAKSLKRDGSYDKWGKCDETRCQCQSGATDGADYTGTLASTVDGFTCKAWPSAPGYTSTGSHNYCRNPSKNSGGVWCYTTSPGKRWQFCDVPICNKGQKVEEEEQIVHVLIKFSIFFCGKKKF